jgi:patatin-related protein
VSSPAPREYTAEVRFGVVMYGGVSLAIYINGVTNEIFEMACATPREGFDIPDPADERSSPSPSRKYYERLSWVVGNADLRARYAERIDAEKRRVREIRGAKRVSDHDDPEDVWHADDTRGFTQTRFAVDVVSGTSAGGINGLFLAKALSNGEQFKALKKLWIDEGDIDLLLNDDRSYAGLKPAIKPVGPPNSLLNSDRMYLKLYHALDAQSLEATTADPAQQNTSPLADELDLYITTTDIKGSYVPLRLFDKVVYERRYKQSYHFRYAGDWSVDSNDFDAINRPFLAFAARCTSSFPFAFEPMTLDAVTRMTQASQDDMKRWNIFFPNLPPKEVAEGRHVARAFGDGGYLDNKPFSYVVDALSHRFSSAPIERKLVFVEPAPEDLDPDDPAALPDPAHKPDALQNALAALTSIPQYETIREDLQAVLTRNRRIERIERVVRLGEKQIGAHQDFRIRFDDTGNIPDWTALKVSEMVAHYGTAFLPYLRLRVYSVTDSIADRLGKRAGFGDASDKTYALRALVRVWRERSYVDEGAAKRKTVSAFLDEFDIAYRLRRNGFVIRKIDKVTRLFRKWIADAESSARATGAMSATIDAGNFSEEEFHFLRVLPDRFFNLQVPAETSIAAMRDGEKVLRVLKRGLLDARRLMLQADRRIDRESAAEVEKHRQVRDELDDLLMQMLSGRSAVIRSGKDGSEEVIAFEAGNTRMASASRTLQESIASRAQDVFMAVDRMDPKPAVYVWLAEGIQSLRMNAGDAAQAPDLSTSGEHEPEVATRASVRDQVATLDEAAALGWELLGRAKLEVIRNSEGIAPDAPNVRVVISDVRAQRLGSIGSDERELLNTPEGESLRLFFSDYYLRFDAYDQMSFPLYYDTGTGEPSTVEVVRISPVDAKNLIDEAKSGRKKLAGTALANFGAFLDRRWRDNDIMWGQLDGAERLIEALLPMNDPATVTVRGELIERVQRAILREALVSTGNAELTTQVVQAIEIAREKSGVDAEIGDLFERLERGGPNAKLAMKKVVASLFDEAGLMAYVRETREIDRRPDPEMTLRSAARAVTITGRVLQVISKQHGAGEAPSRWVARLGLMVQGIVAVSLPGTLNVRWWTHFVKILYAFEATFAVLALVFGNADMRSLAVTAIATTFAVHLLTMIIGDFIRGRGTWIYRAGIGLVLAIVAFAVIGAYTVVRDGPQIGACWADPGSVEPDGNASWVCRQSATLGRWLNPDARP